MPSLALQIADPTNVDVAQLLQQMDAYFADLYPAESIHTLSADALRQPHITFLGAWTGGRIVGCGALVDQAGAYAEFKRLYVLPECRGLGIGQRILVELEARAHAAGLSFVRLETGVTQPEAVRLFERAGYQRRGPFGDYPDDPLSVFLEKCLSFRHRDC